MLILAATINGYVSISDIASLVDIPVVIASSALGIKVFAITPVVKKYKSIINKKKKKKHYNIVLLA